MSPLLLIKTKNPRPYKKGRELTRVATLIESIIAFLSVDITALHRKCIIADMAFHISLQDGFTSSFYRFSPTTDSL